MKKIIGNFASKLIVVIMAGASIFTPAPAVLAQFSPIPCPQGLLCSSGSGTSPVASVNSLIFTVIQWLLSVAFGLAVLFLIIGGIRYVISGGSEESAEAAKSTVINAIIGIILIILSYVIMSVVINTLSSLGGTRTP